MRRGLNGCGSHLLENQVLIASAPQRIARCSSLDACFQSKDMYMRKECQILISVANADCCGAVCLNEKKFHLSTKKQK